MIDGKGPRILCNQQKNSTITPSSKTVQCRCQPGFEIFQGKDGQIQCKPCSKGNFSTGVKCATCKTGHVALPGKHYFLWRSDTLPEGFSASCSGDCTIEVCQILRSCFKTLTIVFRMARNTATCSLNPSSLNCDQHQFSPNNIHMFEGGSVAEWSARRTRNPAVPGSSPAMGTCWICSRSSLVQILGHACK